MPCGWSREIESLERYKHISRARKATDCTLCSYPFWQPYCSLASTLDDHVHCRVQGCLEWEDEQIFCYTREHKKVSAQLIHLLISMSFHLMLNILLIADIVSKIISLVTFVCLAMYGQQYFITWRSVAAAHERSWSSRSRVHHSLWDKRMSLAILFLVLSFVLWSILSSRFIACV